MKRHFITMDAAGAIAVLEDDAGEVHHVRVHDPHAHRALAATISRPAFTRAHRFVLKQSRAVHERRLFELAEQQFAKERAKPAPKVVSARASKAVAKRKRKSASQTAKTSHTTKRR